MFWFDFTWDIQAFLNQFWWQINFLLLVILAVIGYFSYKKPAWACAITIVLLPTYLFRSKISLPVQSNGLEIPFTYLELCLLITFFGWVIHLLLNKSDAKLGIFKRLKPYLKPILLIILGATMAVFISPTISAAAGIWKAYFIEPLLFFIVLLSVIKKNQDREIIIWALGISTLIISLLAISQKFTGFGIAQAGWLAVDHRRVTSIFTSPNAVGLYLAPIILIYFGWLISAIRNKKSEISNYGSAAKTILKFSIILSALAAILFTASSGTILGLAAGLIFLLFFGWNKKWTAAIIGLAIILAIIVPTIRQNLLPVILFQDAAGQNRLILWGMAKDYLSASPKNLLLGAGLGGFAAIENQLRNPLKLEALLYPHNIFLNFWLELGLLGLLGFIWLIINFFKKGFAKARAIRELPLRLGIIAAMTAIIIHGLIDVPYFKNDLAILFWIVAALL